MTLNEDQILALAPDEASKKSGRDLANAAKWVSKGVNRQALWGEAQGSGSKPYQTQIDIINIAFKCSCPSRKFPCKHGLGLMIFYSRDKNAFTDTNAPVWVLEWLSKRLEKEEKKTVQEDKPIDEASREKRRQARQKKVNEGIDELSLWIKDIIRNGILDMPGKGSLWFENMAKRMIDAQAPGLANMIRNLADINFYTDGWQTNFMNQLLSIFLITEGFKNSDHLDTILQQDIRTWIGFTQNLDDLKEETGITDTWMVLAKQTYDVDNITTERNWLYGTKTDRYALVLQFIVRGQGGQLTFTPGMFVQAELVYFPSVSPLRAIVKKQISTNAVSGFRGFMNWQQVVELETGLSAAMPVRSERPFIIKQLIPVQYNNSWWLQDKSKNMMQMKNEQKAIWKLLSLSGGNAIDVVVIGKEDQFELMGVWQDDEYKVL